MGEPDMSPSSHAGAERGVSKGSWDAPEALLYIEIYRKKVKMINREGSGENYDLNGSSYDSGNGSEQEASQTPRREPEAADSWSPIPDHCISNDEQQVESISTALIVERSLKYSFLPLRPVETNDVFVPVEFEHCTQALGNFGVKLGQKRRFASNFRAFKTFS